LIFEDIGSTEVIIIIIRKLLKLGSYLGLLFC